MGFQHTQTIPKTTQTVLAIRGSHGVAREGAMAPGWIRPWTCSLVVVVVATHGVNSPRVEIGVNSPRGKIGITSPRGEYGEMC